MSLNNHPEHTLIRHLLAAAICMVIACNPVSALARDNGVTASVSLRENYDSNTTRRSDNKIGAWSTKISPAITFDSKGGNDSLLFHYSPSYTRNNATKNEKIDHYLVFAENARPHAKWLIDLNEKYIRTDDTGENKDTAFLSSTKLGQNRFWINMASINSTLLFGKANSFGLGYNNTILKNKNTQVANYTRHAPHASFAWQISPRYKTSLSYSYLEGDFELIPAFDPLSPAQPQDITTHTGGISLTFMPNSHSNISTNYQYSETEFKSQNITPDQEPYKVHSANLRLDQTISANTTMAAFFGPSIIDRQTSADENDYNYGLELKSNLQRGSFILSGTGGVDELYFNGSQNDGLTIYWSATTLFTYTLSEYLAINLNGEIRRDKFIDQQPEGREVSYKGGGGFSYNFWRWFTLNISGEYYELDIQTSNAAAQDYDGYRLYFTLTAGRELLRW